MTKKARALTLPLALTSVLLLLAGSRITAQVAQATQPITIAVDATEAPRRILHAHLVIPAAPGPLTLLYPKWLPGEHGPTGPVTDLVGLRFTAAGQPLAWRRDPLEMYAFHLDVPAGATAVEADLDFLAPLESGSFTAGASATERLAVLSWNTVVLYPRGKPGPEITLAASLRPPAGWKVSTALPVAGESGGTTSYRPVSLTTLIDSPAILGAHLTSVPLVKADGLAHQIDVVADGPAALALPEGFAASYDRLVAEAGALFGGRPYGSYRWLVTLSDHVAHFGLEHHESSDNRMPEATLREAHLQRGLGGLLAHEYVHTWNGKYRRPAAMLSPDYQQPMQGELLWVYEGLTQYLGTILSARSGLWTPEYFRERLAQIAANYEHQAGRAWRPLADTAVAAQKLFGSPAEWGAWRRGTDFYDESVLIWLEADAIIRRASNGRRSLDDFCRRFHGGESGRPAVAPYTFEELAATLNEVAPHDWKGFFDARLRSTGGGAPLGGIEAGGWKLAYSDVPNQGIADREQRSELEDWSYSLGFQVKEDGQIRDVIPGLPAAKAGIAPGMKLVAVNGRAYSEQAVEDAILAAEGSAEAVELLVENVGFYRTYEVDYRGGPRYPHLVRDESRPDQLQQVIAPRAGGAGR